MNPQTLIDALVRQTTVLIAQVATASGGRTPLAHIANQVFLDLVGELERQGVGRKVIADMFGLALRSYQQKVQRLSESATDRGVTLWAAVHRYLEEKQVATRGQILTRFTRDDQAMVRGILNDLVESGLVYRTGRGESSVYRIAPEEELRQAFHRDGEASAEPLVWLAVYRNGPIGKSKLATLVSMSNEALDRALSDLAATGRIEEAVVDGESVYRSDQCLLPTGDPAVWGAALVDHYQAVVSAMCCKLRNGVTRALPDDQVGGSTFSFDVWPGHPHEARVRALLQGMRKDVGALWDQVTEHNRGGKPEGAERVTFYFGQLVKHEAETQEDVER